MSIEQFNALAELDKMNLLIVEGRMLFEADLRNIRKSVYQLNDFFVTVSLQPETGKVLQIVTGSDLNVVQNIRDLS